MLRLNLNTIVGFIQKTMYLSCAQMDVHTLDSQTKPCLYPSLSNPLNKFSKTIFYELNI